MSQDFYSFNVTEAELASETGLPIPYVPNVNVTGLPLYILGR